MRLVMIIFFGFWLTGLPAQQEKSFLVSPDGDTVIIKPVPLSEISNQIENATAQMTGIRENLILSEELSQLDSIYNSLASQVQEKMETMEERKEFYSLISLENDLREWENLRRKLDQIKQKVNERVNDQQTDLFNISFLDETWKITKRSATEGGVPETVLTSAIELQNRIAELKKLVSNEQTSILQMQDNLSDLMMNVDEELNSLNSARRDLQSNYFRQDSPVLWKARDTTVQISNMRGQLVSNKDEVIRNLSNFYESYRSTIYLHILLFFTLWIGLFLLHHTTLKDKERYERITSLMIISNYIISALILSIFASIWLYPVIPSLIIKIIQFIYILISFWLLPKFYDKKIVNRLLLYLVALYLFNQFQQLFIGRVLFSRLVLIFEIIFAAYILYKLLTPKGYVSIELKKVKWGFMLKIIPVFYVFLAVALISNVFGFVDLAMLLTNTVVNTLFNLNILLLALIVFNNVMIILIKTPFMQGSNLIRNNTEYLEKRILQLIQILGVILLIRSVFRLLGINEIIADWFSEFIAQSYEVGTTTIKIGGLLVFILVIIITVLLFRFVKVFLAEELFPRIKLPRGVPGAISMITGYIIAGYGFFIALSAAGVDLSTFGLVAGALGVGIGFGLQGIVANFIAGLVLAFERPIQVGDEIEMPQNMGIVSSIGVRSTTIRTYDGSEVIIPNSDLITKDVINWTLSDRKKRRDIYISVAYGTDPEIVLDLIRKVAGEHPNVLSIPAPWALFDGFGESALNFRVRIWTTMDTGMTTKSEVTVAIYDALRREGIEIPFPQRDLHIKSIVEGGPARLKNKKAPVRRPSAKKPGKPRKEGEGEE